ncbi:hypothetical protein CH272_18425 [Rhodococcus sp. 05-340-1]|uniref:multiubiquitin domain-containing protein n=1 Tax=Nocardiaceae TaxID=85025 RepID=UPI00050C4AE6|nr:MULTISPECIES: multiubiquitin domain-containing protein [Rhodococcus]OZC87744.1 hypothetical protein CH254_14375 [Rhodococcus sp. 06-412-2C]OZC96395.1 hypothetical protein CH279_14545 [Rhodococcus sp. 06-412-2B]OZD65379.1 hypothetical protein CH271_20365 [Rhodococcus sp. 05-340-2]OZD74574.1 hypothetical protein CH272_18425 [Rhodococcus sp. 05-340-1]OZD86653.1 hypothetical protein CH273_00600 [Rhodococcus sp. 05-339-2]
MSDKEPEKAGHRTVTLVINTRRHQWDENKISYEQIVELAHPGQAIEPNTDITVRYSRGHDGHGSGTLTAGRSVAVKDGMVFDVHRTTRS